MSIEVKKISDLPEIYIIQGDELIEMVKDGLNVKVRADQLGAIYATSYQINNVFDSIDYLANNKVNRETGKGLIEPAPNNGKPYARKNGKWEVGLRTFLDGTTLYMTDDGSNPDPNGEPEPSFAILVGIYSGVYYGYYQGLMGELIGDLPEGITSIMQIFHAGSEGMFTIRVSPTLMYKEIKFKFGNIEVIKQVDSITVEGEFVVPPGRNFQVGEVVPISYEVLRDL